MKAHGKGSLAAKLVREGYEEWSQMISITRRLQRKLKAQA